MWSPSSLHSVEMLILSSSSCCFTVLRQDSFHIQFAFTVLYRDSHCGPDSRLITARSCSIWTAIFLSSRVFLYLSSLLSLQEIILCSVTSIYQYLLSIRWASWLERLQRMTDISSKYDIWLYHIQYTAHSTELPLLLYSGVTLTSECPEYVVLPWSNLKRVEYIFKVFACPEETLQSKTTKG